MINELVKVANAMQNAKITSADWHPKLKPLPKTTPQKPCIRVWLTNNGRINNMELLSKEKVEQLRKYEPDYGKSLPAFNVLPLYRIVKSEEEMKKSARGKSGEKIKMQWTNDFLSLDTEEQAKEDFWEKTRDVLNQCFGRVHKDLMSLCSKDLRKGETLSIFFNAIDQITVEQFHEEYCNMVRQKFENGEFPPSLICYFVTEERKRKEDNDSKTQLPKFSVFLDIEGYNNYPVSHEKAISRLNELLVQSIEANQSFFEEDSEKDAYGLDTQHIKDKFANITLPFLGTVILRSQAKTIPAQKRYHQCESATFPVGSESRKCVKAAMEWISSFERNGETYGVAGNKELLFAYPRVLPEPGTKITLTKMFGAQEDNSYEKKDTFERLAKTVIGQLQGLGGAVADAELEIFSIRKMDKARTKVVYYHNTTITSLEKASKEWQEGCQNIPSLDVRDWSQDKSEKTGKSYPMVVEGLTVFPIKLHRHLNAIWKQDGTRADSNKSKAKLFEPTDGLRLLLERQDKGLVKHMTDRFMQHAQGYFITLCRSTGKHEISNLPDKKIYPGISGLLLKKLEKKKEDYMKESAFLLGRCLRVTDEIHRLYCEVVRKKELPPELCGSSLLIGMMESPGTTLSQLAMRSAPYIKWARGGSDKGEKGGLVWFWLRQWENVADQLHTLTWPKRLIPEERAQLFLGYLASFQKKTTPSDNSIESENIEK
jgi:hypothetical protein